MQRILFRLHFVKIKLTLPLALEDTGRVSSEIQDEPVVSKPHVAGGVSANPHVQYALAGNPTACALQILLLLPGLLQLLLLL